MINYCRLKLQQSEKYQTYNDRLPRVIKTGESHWTGASINNWTSGFYPGMLWQMYKLTGENSWRKNAEFCTNLLKPIRRLPWKTHDFGFMMSYSYGLGYELTKNQEYANILLETADSLATMFNDRVGLLESWPWMKNRKGWPHTTIIDNMMNLELLFWAAQYRSDAHMQQIATKHAYKTREDFIRTDFSTTHIVVYDSISPIVMQKTTDQGYNAESTWARGHSWATYGFVKAYQYTKNEDFLNTAMNLADFYLAHLPDDFIPYWDFNAPNIPHALKDASAAAIMASALLELVQITYHEPLSEKYYQAAISTLSSLSSDNYLAQKTDAFLRGSVGSMPANSEVDVSMVYTDYFFLEALMKVKKMQNNEFVVGNKQHE